MASKSTKALQLAFRMSRGALTTIAPPIPLAYEWAARFNPSDPSSPSISYPGPLLDTSQGVPGVPPPLVVQAALGRASSSEASFGYTRWDGEEDMRWAVVTEMKEVYGMRGLNKGEGNGMKKGRRDVDVEIDDVALTSGCNLAFVAVMMSLADAGDEVILPVPWYFNHQMTLTLLGINIIPLPCSPNDSFLPSPSLASTLITHKTRAIVLVTPNNPTGAIYPPRLIWEFAQLARERGIALVVDETYRDFIVSNDRPHGLFSSASVHKHPEDSPTLSKSELDWDWRLTFIHLFSFSKSYCLPGHRLGAIVASPVLLEKVRGVLDTMQICAPRPVQIALAPLLHTNEVRAFIKENAGAVWVRHGVFKRGLEGDKEGEESKARWVVGAQGGYFAFVRHPFRNVTSEHVCRRLAEERGVVALPGTFFGLGSTTFPGSVSDDASSFRGVESSVSDIQSSHLGIKSNVDLDVDSKGRVLNWTQAEHAEEVAEAERWVRFSVANVDDEKVRLVCERLRRYVLDFGWKV